MEKIDFVVTWVDGNDEKWLKEKRKYLKEELGQSSYVNRYRDWGTFKYWFRGVEKYAPWVNNIYLITCGQTPDWLNVDHPKLKLINHKDYIPDEYLPTFNSNVIELFLHKIDDLSEHFVLFNDDVFIVNKIDEKDFFKKGIPVDQYMENAIINDKYDNKFSHIVLNDLGIINENNIKKSRFKKRYSLKYGMKRNFINFLCSFWPKTMGFYNPHLALPHLKSSLSFMWDLEGEKLKNTAKNRFRDYDDLNHWLLRYWRLTKGEFVPGRINGKYLAVAECEKFLKKYISDTKCKMVCVNDDDIPTDFETSQKYLLSIFESKFSEKSSFEK